MNFDKMKVGEIARFVLRSLLESGKIPDSEIKNLQEADYCRRVLNLYVPVLVPYTGQCKPVYRYYSPNKILLHIGDKKYLLTNDWYDDANRHQKQPLIDWIKTQLNIIANSSRGR